MSEISSDQEAADSLKADLGDALQQAASLHLAGMSFLGSLGVAAGGTRHASDAGADQGLSLKDARMPLGRAVFQRCPALCLPPGCDAAAP
jgi:hypothetical protein